MIKRQLFFKNQQSVIIFSFAFLALFFSLFSAFTNAESDYRNPFKSCLPEKKIADSQPSVIEEVEAKIEEVPLPPLVIEGILWNENAPSALINGNVYRLNDTLKDADAKVYKIEKNSVSILYNKKAYKFGVTKKNK